MKAELERGTEKDAGRPEPGLVRVDGWDRFAWLRAGFSTRTGGLSEVYGAGEQNLGYTREDSPAIVAENRRRFAEAVTGGQAMEMVTVHQIHGGVVRDLEAEPRPWMTEEGRAQLQGDGLMTRATGRLLAILTADCVPVLVADTRTRAVAAFHAGWRGTLAHIVEGGIGELRSRYGSRPEDLVAAIGPCIRACCFEVGPEVREAFVSEAADAATLFREDEARRLRMDLVEANRRQLAAAGLGREQISAVGACTACIRLPDGRRGYYSYRAEKGTTGRMLSAIGAVAEKA